MTMSIADKEQRMMGQPLIAQHFERRYCQAPIALSARHEKRADASSRVLGVRLDGIVNAKRHLGQMSF
jgi:hypothetical protein